MDCIVCLWSGEDSSPKVVGTRIYNFVKLLATSYKDVRGIYPFHQDINIRNIQLQKRKKNSGNQIQYDVPTESVKHDEVHYSGGSSRGA